MLQAYILETCSKLNLILSLLCLTFGVYSVLTITFRGANGKPLVTREDLVYVIIMITLIVLYIIIPDGIALMRAVKFLR